MPAGPSRQPQADTQIATKVGAGYLRGTRSGARHRQARTTDVVGRAELAGAALGRRTGRLAVLDAGPFTLSSRRVARAARYADEGAISRCRAGPGAGRRAAARLASIVTTRRAAPRPGLAVGDAVNGARAHTVERVVVVPPAGPDADDPAPCTAQPGGAVTDLILPVFRAAGVSVSPSPLLAGAHLHAGGGRQPRRTQTRQKLEEALAGHAHANHARQCIKRVGIHGRSLPPLRQPWR